MDERIYQIAEQIVEIHQKAYEVYCLYNGVKTLALRRNL